VLSSLIFLLIVGVLGVLTNRCSVSTGILIFILNFLIDNVFFIVSDTFFTYDYVSLFSLSFVLSAASKLNEGKPFTDRVMNDNEFNEWFVGFCDGEACFSIKIFNNIIRFYLIICLHRDDRGVLEFIRNRLNCGTISKEGRGTTVSLYICKQEDLLNIIIPLFEKFPLNGVKYLDYLTFKEAILTKLDDSKTKEEKLESITKLKNSMNTKRKSFDMPSSHQIRITPY